MTVAEILQKLLGITLVIFMAGNLLEMGLKFQLEEARKALRNIGAAIAPLFDATGIDQRAIAMCALAVPIAAIMALITARACPRRRKANRPQRQPLDAGWRAYRQLTKVKKPD